MAYELSFAPEFFWGEDNHLDNPPKPSKRPTSVIHALQSMSKSKWNEMCEDVLGCKGDLVDIEDVLAQIEETNTCTNLGSPVEVWIDDEGWYTVDVYGDYEEEEM